MIWQRVWWWDRILESKAVATRMGHPYAKSWQSLIQGMYNRKLGFLQTIYTNALPRESELQSPNSPTCLYDSESACHPSEISNRGRHARRLVHQIWRALEVPWCEHHLTSAAENLPLRKVKWLPRDRKARMDQGWAGRHSYLSGWVWRQTKEAHEFGDNQILALPPGCGLVDSSPTIEAALDDLGLRSCGILRKLSPCT